MPRSRTSFEIDLDSPKYLLALGTFIATFALVEMALNSAVWYFSRLREEPQIARAIFAALRVDAAMNHLNRIIEARKLKGRDIDELKLMFDQLGKIARTRNDIVHLGASRRGQRPFEVTNRAYAHTRTRIRTTTVGPKILQHMTDDLWHIFGRLTVIAHDLIPGETRRSTSAAFPRIVHGAWQYKPRMRSPRPRKRRGPPQGPQRQPRSSRA